VTSDPPCCAARSGTGARTGFRFLGRRFFSGLSQGTSVRGLSSAPRAGKRPTTQQAVPGGIRQHWQPRPSRGRWPPSPPHPSRDPRRRPPRAALVLDRHASLSHGPPPQPLPPSLRPSRRQPAVRKAKKKYRDTIESIYDAVTWDQPAIPSTSRLQLARLKPLYNYRLVVKPDDEPLLCPAPVGGVDAAGGPGDCRLSRTQGRLDRTIRRLAGRTSSRRWLVQCREFRAGQRARIGCVELLLKQREVGQMLLA
jgi:hypothetical protein